MKNKPTFTVTRSDKGTEVSINTNILNRRSWILYAFVLVFIIHNKQMFDYGDGLMNTHIPLILLFIAGIVLHDLIHGLLLGLFAPNGFKSVRFKRIKDKKIRSCHCIEAIKIGQYRITYLAPVLLLGLFPLIAGLIGDYSDCILLGFLFTILSLDDLYILWLLRPFESRDYVIDRPDETGFRVLK